MKVTERGGSVVTHETRIREVPGSNPGADEPGWGFFVVFLSKGKGIPLQAMKAHGGCECKGPHIHSHGTRKR